MIHDFSFNEQVLNSVVGGVSVLDIAHLNVNTDEQAKQFLEAYGYDLSSEQHREQLWATHRRAVAMLKEELLDAGEVIPDDLTDSARLGRIERLLILASSRRPEDAEMQKWACAVLKVMHVYTHLRNDLFSAFSEEIQSQILRPIQDVIITDPGAGAIFLGRTPEDDGIRLHRFDVKPFKTTASSVIKLLAKPGRVALTLLDKLGVRFVTRNVFDSFRVIRFLCENHIVSYPHIMPDQSNNTLYPLNLFFETIEELKDKPHVTDPEIDELLKKKLNESVDRAQYLAKENQFSGNDYRFIKFINRKLITVEIGHGESLRHFRFFYPYEIQVMDHSAYVTALSGPMAHDEYKNRQRKAARERVFGESRGNY